MTAKSTATQTAAIAIFLQAIVSVDPTRTSSHTRPATEMAEVKMSTWCDLNETAVMTQQHQEHPKIIRTTTETSIIQAADSSAAASALPSLLMPQGTCHHNFILATAKGGCKSLAAAWGDSDPNIFYLCDTHTMQPLQLRCPEGKGFFLGLGYSGCIPYEEWPACLSSGHQVAVCDSEHMQQPWEYKDPNKFYVCLKETIEPAIVNCGAGKGFVHATVTTSVGAADGGEIVGCAKWEKWRNYMQCNDYI